MAKKQPLLPILTQTIKEGKIAYQNILSKTKYDYFTENIDCSKLTTPSWVKNPIYPNYIQSFLNKLPDKKHACLYYFEIPAKQNIQTILTAYEKFGNDKKNHKRACSALKKHTNIDTNILYVGEVKKDIKGRMMVHLGYYYNKQTSGLQLFCWAKRINLKLQLHIYIFHEEMRQFVLPLELPLAHSLKPLIGRH